MKITKVTFKFSRLVPPHGTVRDLGEGCEKPIPENARVMPNGWVVLGDVAIPPQDVDHVHVAEEAAKTVPAPPNPKNPQR